MKKRVMSLCVTVTGPPCAIWRWNVGTTLPLVPSTLPKRTAEKCVALSCSKLCTIISAMRLVAPMTLVGLTALSVEIITKRSTPNSLDTRARLWVPNTLFLTASQGLCSMSGTCLCAAAWKTTAGCSSSNTSRRRFTSCTEPMYTRRRSAFSGFSSSSCSMAKALFS